MALSKPLEIRDQSSPQNVGNYDFLDDWDICDYIDPVQLPISKNDHDLLILQWNTKGLRGKYDTLTDFLNNVLEQKADIIMVNETWLNNQSPPLLLITGYKFVGKPRSDRKGGGVGFLIRDDVIFRGKENLEIKSKTLENIVIEIKGKSNLLLCSGYRPPNTDLVEFLASYDKMVNNLKALKHTESVIGIDHNLDFIKHHLHKPTKMFIESNIDNNILPTITRPTRITKTSATVKVCPWCGMGLLRLYFLYCGVVNKLTLLFGSAAPVKRKGARGEVRFPETPLLCALFYLKGPTPCCYWLAVT